MSKEQLTEQQPAQDGAAQTTGAQDETFGLHPRLYAQIQQLSPADDGALAEMLQAYPSLMGKILAVAAQQVGNATVQRAIALVKRWKAQSPGGSMNKEEVRASIDSPADSKPIKENEMASFLEDKSDTQAPDEAPTKPKAAPAADPAWVADARRYNDAHADLVAEFNDLTNDICLDDDTSKLEPKAVFDWQVAHGLDPDGKIGPRTVAAARAVKSKGASVAKAEQAEARIPV